VKGHIEEALLGMVEQTVMRTWEHDPPAHREENNINTHLRAWRRSPRIRVTRRFEGALIF
jgi:hypothetical protein